MTHNTIVSAIAAIGKNRELGKDNGLLWHIPEDAKFFKDMTSGHVIIMGRKTFESFPKLLPNRTHIVVTRDKGYKVPDGCFVFTDIKDAIEFGKKEEEKLRQQDLGKPAEVYIIGGGQIFEAAMSYTDRLYLTIIDEDFPDADAYFPEYPEFTKIVAERKSGDGKYSYEFLTLEKPTERK